LEGVYLGNSKFERRAHRSEAYPVRTHDGTPNRGEF
jgi:hypothetical protein